MRRKNWEKDKQKQKTLNNTRNVACMTGRQGVVTCESGHGKHTHGHAHIHIHTIIYT